MRLAGGFTPNEGRLEVHNAAGQWGQASGVGATNRGAARVACRQLGLGGGAMRRGFYSEPADLPGAYDFLE